MPRPQTNDPKSKKRGRHRAKRQKWAATEPKHLYSDAPIGTYRIDKVALELLQSGRAAGATDPTQFVTLIRNEINLAARYALIAVTGQFDREPQRRRFAKRFFEDLRVIRSRIVRNKNLERIDLVLSTTLRFPRPPLKQKGGGNEIDRLLAALQDASELIGEYLKRYKPDARGGNHDYLTRTFIAEVFEFWCDYYTAETSNDESRLFKRLLCAAWRDVGFPADDEDGQSLEDRLADRVRKQFRGGIPSARVSREEFLAPQPPDPDPSAPPDPN